MTIRGLIRRWAADPVTALATVITVALSMMLLAAGPIYSDAVAVGSIRQSVTEATDPTVIEVAVRTAPDGYDALDQLARAEIERAVRPLPVAISGMIGSDESFELPDQPGGTRVDLTRFVSVGSIDEYATITEGRWPTDDASSDEVAVDDRVADLFALTVGDALRLEPRSGSADTAEITIVGRYALDDPFDPFWTGREDLVGAVAESETFRTTVFVTTEESMRSGLTGRADASWLAAPGFDELEPDDAGPIRRRVSGLEERINASAVSQSAEGTDATMFEVTTAVPSILAGSDRSVTVARSAVLAVVLQLALLAGYALVLVAGLNVDARASESAMLRARGAGSSQLLGNAVLEAVLLVVPTAAIAPQVAAWALRVFDEFGPLESIGMQIDPRPVGASYVAVAVAAVVVIVLLALPAYRAARAAERAEHRHGRRRSTSSAQRAGLDVAVIVVTVLAFWQLSTLGDERAASVRGRFGVDPLVIVAPMFGLIAGAFLAIRVIPLLARVAERRVERSRSIVGALSGWQFARRPVRYGRSGLLLIMAVAIGTFAVTYESTWLRSQQDQADQQVGADARVTPNRRTNDSVADLGLVGLHEQLDGVERSVPVSIVDAGLPATDEPARLIGLDAARASFSSSRPGAQARLDAALGELAAARPVMAGVELPGRPAALELEIEVADPRAEVAQEADDGDTEADETAEAPPPVLFRGAVVLVLQDGLGHLHRMGVGTAAPDAAAERIDLAVRAADGTLATPMYPLSIVDIEIRTVAPSPPSADVTVTVGPIRLTDIDGTERQIGIGQDDWQDSATPLGFLGEPTSIEPAAEQPDESLVLAIETGSSFTSVPVVYRLRPVGTPTPLRIPAVMTSDWMTASRTSVGDEFSVSLGRAEPVPLRVVGVVDSIPTVDSSTTPGVLVDLPTLQMSTYSNSGAVDDVSEHWLTVRDDVPVVGLESVPVEAVDVVVREQRRTELASDPPALGAIGALTLGFVAAAVFALVGFVVTTVISARERRLEFALVRALGLTMRQLRRWMLIEQVTLVVIGVVVGTGIGIGLAALVLPLVSLTQGGGEVVPPVLVTIPWGTVALLQVSLVAGLAVGLAMVNAMIRRMVVGTALRAGSEA